MNEQQPKKPIYKRWWFWGIIVLILAILVGLTAYSGYKKDHANETKEGTKIGSGKEGVARGFTDDELAAANTALAAGITIDDPRYDWYKYGPGVFEGDGRPNSAEPYPLDWADLRSLSVGADQNYLYVKYRYWGDFPKEAVTYHDDLVSGVGGKISIIFENKENKKDSGELSDGIIYIAGERGQGVPTEPYLTHQTLTTPQGLDKESETIYKLNSGDGLVGGGPDFDYLLGAYPLSLYGLKLGDEITFECASESGSNKYHHAANDNLLDQENYKLGMRVKYTLGGNTYETVPNIEGGKLEEKK